MSAQHSDGAEAPLPPQQEQARAPDQSSTPPQGRRATGERPSGSVEGVTAQTQGPISPPIRPLPSAPPIETQGAYAGAASPTLGRYPAPLSPTGIGFPVTPSHRVSDPFQHPAGESSSRPPSGGRNGRPIMSGVYTQSAEAIHPQGPEADITDQRVLPTRRPTGQGLPGQGQGRPNASVEDEENALKWIVPNVRDSNAMLSGRGISMIEKRVSSKFPEVLQRVYSACLFIVNSQRATSKNARGSKG